MPKENIGQNIRQKKQLKLHALAKGKTHLQRSGIDGRSCLTDSVNVSASLSPDIILRLQQIIASWQGTSTYVLLPSSWPHMMLVSDLVWHNQVSQGVKHHLHLTHPCS